METWIMKAVVVAYLSFLLLCCFVKTYVFSALLLYYDSFVAL